MGPSCWSDRRGRALPAAVFFLAAAVAAPARAAFEDLGAGARAIGMGNAFSALSDDAQAAYYDPAGLAGLEGGSLVSSYGRLHLGLDDGSSLSSGFVGYAQSLGGSRGAVAASLGTFGLAGWYQEQAFRASYGRRVARGLAAGLSVKYLRVKVGQDEYTAQDPVFAYGAKDSVSAPSLDLAALYRPSGSLSFALALQDVNRPDLGFGSVSRVPLGLRAGAVYLSDSLTLAADLLRRDGETKVYTGVERWLERGRFALRGGLGAGGSQFADLSVGFGFAERRFRVDYAFLYPLAGVASTMGTHHLGLTLAFGSSLVEEPKPPELPPPPLVVVPAPPPPAPPAAAPAPKPKPSTKSTPKPPEGPRFPLRHVVAPGDSLRSLAAKYYGDPGKWIDIYKANRGSIGPEGDLAPGQALTIPEASK